MQVMYINTGTKLTSAKWWLTDKEPACQHTRHMRHGRQKFDLWVGKIP